MAKRELKPLKISCTSTDCDNNLHCFKSTQQMKRRNEQGRCRQCGADLVDWKRVHKRNLSDVNHTFDAWETAYHLNLQPSFRSMSSLVYSLSKNHFDLTN